MSSALPVFNQTPQDCNNGCTQGFISTRNASLKSCVYLEDFLLILFAFSNNLAFYLNYKDMIVLTLGLVLTFAAVIILLLSYITELKKNRCLLFPFFRLLIGLCFVFQDPDVIKAFANINSEPSYFPSLLVLILFSIISKEKTNNNIVCSVIFLLLAVLSLCLTVLDHKIASRNAYLFAALLFILADNFKIWYFAQKKIKPLDFQIEESECDLEFEEITSKLEETTEILSGIFAQTGDLQVLIKKSILNLRTVSVCLQKKANIYAVKVNSVTRNMDEQDKIFIEESCFINQIKKNDYPESHLFKVQSEGLYGVTELLGLLKGVGKDWNFNTFFLSDCCNNMPIQVAGKYVFGHFGLDELFKVPSSVLKFFLKALEQSYTEHPYHNSTHATDVMSSYLFLICNSKLFQFISNLDIMAGVIAALGHDAGHPAKNNRFLVATKHSIAIQYNDISVLEMLHSSLVFQIMLKPECNVFANLTTDQWNLARKIIIEMILATDMSKHFDLLGQFRGKYKAKESFDLNNSDMKLELFRLVIKAADIGHAAKNIELHEKWCKLVVEEFYTQGDLEKSLGLPISMYCDRETTDISKSQAGFIKNIVLPLFTAINFVLESDTIETFCVEQLRTNELFWVCRRKNIRGRSLVVKEDYVNHLNNLTQIRSSIRKPSLPHKFLS